MTREKRRTVIARAAEELFAQHGYAEASMDAIAKRAGVTAPVIYQHFGSKAGLHLALLEERGPAILVAVAERVAATDGAEARLRAGIDAFFTFVRAHPATWRLLFRDAPADPAVAEVARRQQAQTTTAIAALLRADAGRWLERDPAPDEATEIVAELLKSGLNGLAGWWWDHPDVPRERLVEVVMDAVFTGLERLRG